MPRVAPAGLPSGSQFPKPYAAARGTAAGGEGRHGEAQPRRAGARRGREQRLAAGRPLGSSSTAPQQAQPPKHSRKGQAGKGNRALNIRLLKIRPFFLLKIVIGIFEINEKFTTM